MVLSSQSVHFHQFVVNFNSQAKGSNSEPHLALSCHGHSVSSRRRVPPPALAFHIPAAFEDCRPPFIGAIPQCGVTSALAPPTGDSQAAGGGLRDAHTPSAPPRTGGGAGELPASPGGGGGSVDMGPGKTPCETGASLVTRFVSSGK